MKLSRFMKYLKESVPDKPSTIVVMSESDDVDELKDKVQELTESVKDLSDLVVKMAGKLGYKAE